MPTLTEVFHDGGFLISEGNGHQSREKVTILSGEVLKAGAVVAKVTASGKYVEWDPAKSAEADGTTIPRGILFGAVDATGADKSGVIMARNCEVNANEVVWPTASQGSERNAAIVTLTALGIIFRS